MDDKPSWRPSLKSAAQWFLSAIVGGAVVALVNQYFAVQLERDKKLLDIRNDGYVRFFEGQAARRVSPDGKYRFNTTVGRFIIGVYSNKDTVETASAFIDLADKTNTDPKVKKIEDCFDPNKASRTVRDRWMNDIHIYQRMRDEVFGGGGLQNLLRGDYRVDDKTLMLLVDNCRLPDQAAN